MNLSDVLLAGTSVYAALIVAAHVLAWLGRERLGWTSLAVAAAVPMVLLFIGLANNDAHGTGLDGLGLAMLLVCPVALLVTCGFALTVSVAARLGTREQHPAGEMQ